MDYLSNGGALFCAATCWGHLQLCPNEKLKDIDLYKFLKDYMGMILTEDVLSFPDEIKVSENNAKYSHLDLAINKITSNPDKIKKYSGTLSYGLDILNDEGILTCQRISEIKDLIRIKCEDSGCFPFPTEKCPLKNPLEKNICKLLGKCYNYTDGEKAPVIDLFPGDFVDKELNLRSDLEFKFESKFEERISTGFYLPAGLRIVINVISGNVQKWSVRIGSHTDDLSGCKELKRWPIVTVRKDLEKNMCFSSPFGGLVYFECQEDSSPIRVSISNVVESPFLDLTRPETVLDWNRRKNSSGLW